MSRQHYKPYKIESPVNLGLIGEGLIGLVYEARNSADHAKIVIKQMPLLRFGDKTDYLFEKLIGMAHREVEMLKKIQHKSLVSYLDIARQQDSLAIMQEYMPQPTLKAWIKNNTTRGDHVSEPIISKFVESILQGLEYLHHNKVAHGSIKSANIFVTGNGLCKLADFGQIKQICSMGVSLKRQKLHDIYWTAPELICKKEEPFTSSRFSDIWSLGCIVYEMITGHPPWFDEDELTLIFKFVTIEKGPKYPSQLSDEIRDFMTCCFQIEPSRRANVYELMRHPFVQ